MQNVGSLVGLQISSPEPLLLGSFVADLRLFRVSVQSCDDCCLSYLVAVEQRPRWQCSRKTAQKSECKTIMSDRTPLQYSQGRHRQLVFTVASSAAASAVASHLSSLSSPENKKINTRVDVCYAWCTFLAWPHQLYGRMLRVSCRPSHLHATGSTLCWRV